MSLYSRSRARRSIIDTVSYRAISQVATILGYVVMVRGMSQEDFGVYNLLYAFIPVLSTIGSLGLEQTLRRYQPEYLQSGNEAAARWLVRFVASSRFGLNAIILAIILLAWNTAAPLFKLTPYRAEFVLFGALVLLYFQARILQLSLGARMLHRLSVGSIAVLNILKLIMYSTLAWHDALTLDRVIMADTAAFGVVYAILRLAYHRTKPSNESSLAYRPDKVERRRLFHYAFYNNFNDAGSLILNSRSDLFFLAAILDPIAVGVYAFYTRLDNMTQHIMPVQLFDKVLQPLLFALPKEAAATKMPRYFTLLINLNLMLQWPVLAFAIAYHQEIVQFAFGGKFVSHSWLLPLIAGFSTLNVVATPVTLVAQHQEKAAIILLSKIFTVYNIIMLLALLPILGVYGAAIASGSAQLFKNALIWWHVRDTARWENWLAAVASSFVLWGTVVLICWVTKNALDRHLLLSLCIGAFVVGAGTLLHVRGPAIADSDRTILSGVFKGREGAILRALGLARAAPSDPRSVGTEG